MKTRFLNIFIAFILLLITGCNLKKQAPEPLAPQIPPELGVPLFDQTIETSTDCSGPGSFGYMTLISPVDFSRELSQTPHFIWTFTNTILDKSSIRNWADYCIPAWYTLYLQRGQDSDVLSFEVTDPEMNFTNDYLILQWDITTTLEPASIYRWAVVGHYGDIEIGASAVTELSDDSKWLPFNEQTGQGLFVTGPACSEFWLRDVHGLQINLLYPEIADYIPTQKPMLQWSIGEGEIRCIPDMFEGEIRSWQTHLYYSSFQTEYFWWGDFSEDGIDMPLLFDCRDYFWDMRVGIIPIHQHQTQLVWEDWGTRRLFSNTEPPRHFFGVAIYCPTLAPPPPPLPVIITPSLTPLPPPTISCESLTTEDDCNQYPATCTWNLPSRTDPVARCVDK